MPQAAAKLLRCTVQLSFANGTGRCLCRVAATEQRVDSPRAVAVVLSVCTERVSFAIALAGAFAALRRPSRGRQAAPSALPGPAPAPLAAARCLHSLSLPDGPASIRSCSTPPLAASMPLALEGLTRSASGDGASHPPLHAMIFFAAAARREDF